MGQGITEKHPDFDFHSTLNCRICLHWWWCAHFVLSSSSTLVASPYTQSIMRIKTMTTTTRQWQWIPFNEQLKEILIPDLLPGRSQFLETTLKTVGGEPGCYWHGLWKMMDEGGIFLVIVSCSRHWHVVAFSEWNDGEHTVTISLFSLHLAKLLILLHVSSIHLAAFDIQE